MQALPTDEERESRFLTLLEKKPLPVTDLLTLIRATDASGATQAEEWTLMLLQELTDAADFGGLYLTVKDRIEQLGPALKGSGIRDTLKKANNDRLIAAMIDSVGFGEDPLEASFRRLDRLLALKPGTLVIDASWGLGTVKRLDDFYKRITINFDGKANHAMSFAAAGEALDRPPHNHLLTLRHNDPDGVVRMTAEQPGELVKSALRSFGDMPIAKLEELLTRLGFVAAANWKSFWDSARKTLKQDPLVVIPTKRTESLHLLAAAESYENAWFEKLAGTTDPLLILQAVCELEAANQFVGIEETRCGILEERLAFAVKGAHNTDAALYARLAATVSRLGFLTPPADQMRAHLWENNRYIEAAEKLSIRDISGLVTFLLAEGGTAASRMLGKLARMPFSLLNEVLTALKENAETATVCRQLLAQPKAPPTLINWIFRFRNDIAWPLPPLGELLNHAIALVEGRQSGESLRMQNNLKLLFEQRKWLESVFAELDTPQRQLFFERIQASQAWDPSTHRSLLGRMLNLDPSLEERKRSAATQPQAEVRWTSWRSFKQRQLQYKRLVEVELPKNSQDIAVARSYGDLRENFEYQAAKDYQRQILQRQDEIQQELKVVKGTDFADAASDTVGPGTTVVLRLADGSQRTYTILGEWDRDEHLNIISNKSRLAQNLAGKSRGDTALIPNPAGEETVQIEDLHPLDATIREWIRTLPEETV